MHAAILPETWQGTWRGDVAITAGDGTTELVIMQMSVEPLPDDAHTWRIEYITDKQHTVRPYIIAPDKARGPGHFLVDEQNGILLDCTLFDATLLSQFQVDGALLMSRFEQQGDTIRVEIASFAAFSPRCCRSDEGSAEVLSYSCRSLQHGTLRRTA